MEGKIEKNINNSKNEGKKLKMFGKIEKYSKFF